MEIITSWHRPWVKTCGESRNLIFLIVGIWKNEDWGIGGKAMTTKDVKALQAGK